MPKIWFRKVSDTLIHIGFHNRFSLRPEVDKFLIILSFNFWINIKKIVGFTSGESTQNIGVEI